MLYLARSQADRGGENMRFQDLMSAGPVTGAGLWIGRHMPRSFGYGLARAVSQWVATFKPGVYWIVRANLHQVLGDVGDAELHRMTRRVFLHAGQVYYDFFRAITRERDRLTEAVHLRPGFVEFLKSCLENKRGVLLLSTHMSNFDLAGVCVAAHGIPIQLLPIADPKGGFQIFNKLREAGGFQVTPLSAASLRAAVRRLRNGGIVVTGMDRPVPQEGTQIEFFGRPSYLPTGPARMALISGAQVIVGSCHHDPARGYVLETTDPIEMKRKGEQRQSVLYNAQRLAAILEDMVRAHPDQWLMFHPVWGDPLPPAVG